MKLLLIIFCPLVLSVFLSTHLSVHRFLHISRITQTFWKGCDTGSGHYKYFTMTNFHYYYMNFFLLQIFLRCFLFLFCGWISHMSLSHEEYLVFVPKVISWEDSLKI